MPVPVDQCIFVFLRFAVSYVVVVVCCVAFCFDWQHLRYESLQEYHDRRRTRNSRWTMPDSYIFGQFEILYDKTMHIKPVFNGVECTTRSIIKRKNRDQVCQILQERIRKIIDDFAKENGIDTSNKNSNKDGSLTNHNNAKNANNRSNNNNNHRAIETTTRATRATRATRNHNNRNTKPPINKSSGDTKIRSTGSMNKHGNDSNDSNDSSGSSVSSFSSNDGRKLNEHNNYPSLNTSHMYTNSTNDIMNIVDHDDHFEAITAAATSAASAALAARPATAPESITSITPVAPTEHFTRPQSTTVYKTQLPLPPSLPMFTQQQQGHELVQQQQQQQQQARARMAATIDQSCHKPPRVGVKNCMTRDVSTGTISSVDSYNSVVSHDEQAQQQGLQAQQAQAQAQQAQQFGIVTPISIPRSFSRIGTSGSDDIGNNTCDNNSISDSCFSPYTPLLNVKGNNDNGYGMISTENQNCDASVTSWENGDTYGALRGIGNKVVYSHRMDPNLGHFTHNNIIGNMNHSTGSAINCVHRTNNNSNINGSINGNSNSNSTSNRNQNSNKCAIYGGGVTCDTGRPHNVNNSRMNGFGYQHGSNGTSNIGNICNSNSNRYSNRIGSIGGRLNSTVSNCNTHSRMNHGILQGVMTNNSNNSINSNNINNINNINSINNPNNPNNPNNGSSNPLIWSGMMNRQSMTNMMTIAPIPTMGNVGNCGTMRMPGVTNEYTSNNGPFAPNGYVNHGN